MKKMMTATLAATVLAFSTTAMAAPGKNPSDASIVDIAVGNGNFTTLVDLVIAAGLADTLANTGQYTVFAPTDAAFGTDADGIIAILEGACGAGQPAIDALTNILLYHVTDGRRFSNSVINRNNAKPIEMLNGSYVLATPMLMIIDENVLTDNAGITAPFNVSASNGVIHAIDEVLFPAELCLD